QRVAVAVPHHRLGRALGRLLAGPFMAAIGAHLHGAVGIDVGLAALRARGIAHVVGISLRRNSLHSSQRRPRPPRKCNATFSWPRRVGRVAPTTCALSGGVGGASELSTLL